MYEQEFSLKFKNFMQNSFILVPCQKPLVQRVPTVPSDQSELSTECDQTIKSTVNSLVHSLWLCVFPVLSKYSNNK